MIKQILGVTAVAVGLAASTPAAAVVQMLSFSGTLNNNSKTTAANVFGYAAANTALTNQTFAVTLSYELTQFAGSGSCGVPANTSCSWTLSASRSISQSITVNGLTQNYVLTGGNFTLNASGNDAFSFSISGSQVANITGNFTAANANANGFFPNQSAVNNAAFSSFGAMATQNVSFTETSNQFYAQATGGSITSLAATTVPEPATWAMMIAGFGGVGIGLRRQRRKVIGAIRLA